MRLDLFYGEARDGGGWLSETFSGRRKPRFVDGDYGVASKQTKLTDYQLSSS